MNTIHRRKKDGDNKRRYFLWLWGHHTFFIMVLNFFYFFNLKLLLPPPLGDKDCRQINHKIKDNTNHNCCCFTNNGNNMIPVTVSHANRDITIQMLKLLVTLNTRMASALRPYTYHVYIPVLRFAAVRLRLVLVINKAGHMLFQQLMACRAHRALRWTHQLGWKD